jgi:hypothetical protein
MIQQEEGLEVFKVFSVSDTLASPLLSGLKVKLDEVF